MASGGAGSSQPVLEIRDLHTEFRLRSTTVRAIDGVSLTVRKGECLGIVGESGCGKSTLGLSVMKLLSGVGHITKGEILLNGKDLVPYKEKQMQKIRGNNIGMIFQDPMTALDPTMTIGKQIAETVQVHKKASWETSYSRALEILSLVGMPQPKERLRYYPHQLSGGLRQRVVIAMALACEPELLIADEPTTALDVAIQAQILDLMDDLRQRMHMGVILITHDLGVIAARADRVQVMYAGKVAEAADTKELFGKLRHPYSEALLKSIPRIDQRRDIELFHIAGIPPDLGKAQVGCRFAPRCLYATAECRKEEPALSSDVNSPSPPVKPEIADKTAIAPAVNLDAHFFACFHPVGVTQRPIEPEVIPEVTQALESAKEVKKPSLILENVVKEYQAGGGIFGQSSLTVKAVSNVSFSIPEGTTFGLVGESGCGKTTIGRLVVSLEKPTRGTVAFEGQHVSNLTGRALRQRRRDLQMMFQDPYSSLDPRMRVGAIIREPLDIQQIGTPSARSKRVRELLDEVGLPHNALERYPHEFSGGQRQRIGLARALALSPKLIVADEPVSALDVSIQSQILNLLRNLQRSRGMTFIIISHDLAVVKYMADNIGVMYLGKLVEVGPADDVYGHAAHPYTRGLIDTVPEPDPNTTRGLRAAIKGELPSAIAPPRGCRFHTRCPYAKEICKQEEPPLRSFGGAHRAACHFPLQTPEGATPTAP